MLDVFFNSLIKLEKLNLLVLSLLHVRIVDMAHTPVIGLLYVLLIENDSRFLRPAMNTL